MKSFKRFMIVAGFIALSGCAVTHMRRAEIYNMSYDQTYEVVMGALDDMEPWRLIQTNHENGLIVIQSAEFLRPERRVEIMVKRIEPFRTKVELYHRWATPFNQKFFKAIDRRVEERALTYPS